MNTETEMTSLNDTHESDARDSSKKPLDTTKTWKRFWFDTWRWEILAWAFSIACFVGICILLKIYENKQRPQLAYKLSLNAIISVLATACKSALFLVVGEAVCQLKWLYFQGPRQQRLSSLQEFDNASRGPLGSISIILSHRAQSLVSLGAAVIVILLVFEPFMQQVISYPVLPVNITGGRAVAKQLHGALVSPEDLVNLTSGEAFRNSEGLSNDFAAAWVQGLWSSEGFEVAPVCSSGNCTWEEFTSAGICSQCSDMTASAGIECNTPSLDPSFNTTCQIKIPDGDAYSFSVNTSLPDEIGIAKFTLPSSVFWRVYDNGNPAMNTSMAPYVTFGMRSPIIAYGYAKVNISIPPHVSSFNSSIISIGKLTVCGLGDCLRNYNVSTRNGQPSIQTGDPEFGMRYNKQRHAIITGPDSKFHYAPEDGSVFTSCWVPDDQSKADFAYCVPWTNSSLPMFSRSHYSFPQASDTESLNYHSDGSSPNGDRILNYFTDRCDNIGFENIMSNVAASFTKLQLEKTKGTFSGTAHSSEVFVKVRWEWMILPGCLVLAGSCFFIATMVVNRRAKMPLWKSSALATLYHGLEKQEEDELVTAISMELQAENSKVRLTDSGDGRLVLRKSLKFDSPNLPGPDPTRFESSAHEYTRI
ncbi:unnamed protein product [Penicillium salamii]|uniref:Uncharacterized protein n=1 Tax=Penicillium salamii TaxID=1612424 RepID=A0A9W4JF70_9EURO|nr:unnamed protein product [Penicillium salamii]CAG8282182.1 unnamed protein product [Penicillium salamii]CAG8384674.1 unnamed protein product [Penicillium salamii]CAG8388681.1 unnamed protein product [Penicillium salamii]CAG8391663.1 unnamed protein product [Penicillium salamii]